MNWEFFPPIQFFWKNVYITNFLKFLEELTKSEYFFPKGRLLTINQLGYISVVNFAEGTQVKPTSFRLPVTNASSIAFQWAGEA